MEEKSGSKGDSRIEMLNAKNYTTWKIVMTSVLKSKNLWGYVMEPPTKPTCGQIRRGEDADVYNNGTETDYNVGGV